MSIFDKIQHAIFGDKGLLGTGIGATKAPAPAAAPASAAPRAPGVSPAPAAPVIPVAPAAAPHPVDVEAVLTAKAAALGKPSNWRTSIVDLMMLLGLDSSRQNRTELARELGYTGSTEDSAAMNIWLHRQVMTKLAQNGGVVPPALRD
ncbi:DUF3597 domain-containing protein [Sphingomonas montana]|uniref:DUF3597 domain-containing protein n=1 Tax=Sphingomonas montana TaxID=1843236 RepID=UPI00096FEF71|nr:DUF3597 domain-containing protein [Sphingomonas montana]